MPISARFQEARAIAAFARDLFLKGEVDQVQIVATRFINTLTPAARFWSSIYRLGKSRGSRSRERNPKRSWRPVPASSYSSRARAPFWAFSSHTTSTFTCTRSC